MLKITKDKALIINIIFMVLLAFTLIFDYMVKDGVHIFRIVLSGGTAWVFYFVYKMTFLRKSRISYYLIFSFIFASTYLGSVFDMYEIISGYDKILHLLSGIIIALVGYVFFLSLVKSSDKDAFNPLLGIIFSIIFAIAAAAVWEIWEFSTDQLLGFTSQNNSLIDTMWDIICGTVMGIVANIPIYLNLKGKKIKVIQIMIDEMSK